jgi:hypothetical protein
MTQLRMRTVLYVIVQDPVETNSEQQRCQPAKSAPLAQIVGTASSVGLGGPSDPCESKNGSHNPMSCPFAVMVGNGRSIERVLFVPPEHDKEGLDIEAQ